MHFSTTLKNNYLYWIAFLLLLPSLFLELGSMPLTADEPTRALVALEMTISKNYIVPTINGNFYYNKPPLYNWLLVGLYKLTGSSSEWVVRIPVVASLFLMMGFIYRLFKPYFGKEIGILTAFAFVTSGRILFYDSFLGLMDVLFSCIIFFNCVLIFNLGEKKKNWQLFLYSYLLISISYMLKGLPGLVFQGITLITYFIFIHKNWKLLFSIQHISGILLFCIPLGCYYFIYLQYNSIDTLFSTLLHESTKRTIVENPFQKTFIHLITFPIETFLNFLPWTFLLIVLIKKDNWSKIKAIPFVFYLAMVAGLNLAVYWLSPETVPRYLFMFLPMMFGVGFYLYFQSFNERFRFYFEKSLIAIMLLALLAYFISFYYLIHLPLPYTFLRFCLIGVIFFLILLLWLYNKQSVLIIFVLFLLTVRIGFNLFIIPIRLQTEPQVTYKKYGEEVGKITKGNDLFLYQYTPSNHDLSFYITQERGIILTQSFDKIKKNTFYITCLFNQTLKKENVTIYYEFYTGYQNTKLYLVKTNP